MTASDPDQGLAFTMPTKVGHLVGVVTHDIPGRGEFVWIAEPTFPAPPTIGDVLAIVAWRWPTYFPARTAIRAKVATRIGLVPVPPQLRAFPILRSGHRQIGWVAFTYRDGDAVNLGATTDWSLPMGRIVNATALRELVESHWRPESEY